MLYVAAKLGLADLLKDGPRAVNDLATATQTKCPSLAPRIVTRFVTPVCNRFF